MIENRKKFLQEQSTDEMNVSNDDNDDDVPKKKLSFLDTLLTARVDGNKLTDTEISNEVSTFIFAVSFCSRIENAYDLENLNISL